MRSEFSYKDKLTEGYIMWEHFTRDLLIEGLTHVKLSHYNREKVGTLGWGGLRCFMRA